MWVFCSSTLSLIALPSRFFFSFAQLGGCLKKLWNQNVCMGNWAQIIITNFINLVIYCTECSNDLEMDYFDSRCSRKTIGNSTRSFFGFSESFIQSCSVDIYVLNYENSFKEFASCPGDFVSPETLDDIITKNNVSLIFLHSFIFLYRSCFSTFFLFCTA